MGHWRVMRLFFRTASTIEQEFLPARSQVLAHLEGNQPDLQRRDGGGPS
jgi:hypothetical protein